MRANKISTVSKKIFTVYGVKGVDLSSTPTDISSNRAASLVNMISENGVNHKRHGRERVTSFNGGRINGIYDYKYYDEAVGEYKTETLVHAGTSFYKMNGKEITVKGFTVTDGRSMAFQGGEKLYIMGCGAFCAYDGTLIKKVCGSDSAYVPKTTIGISEKSGGASLEKVNMLTRRRINTIVGSSSEDVYFYLDSKIDNSKDITIEIEADASSDTGYKFLYKSSKTLNTDDAGFDDYFIKKIFGNIDYETDEEYESQTEASIMFNKKPGQALFLETAKFYFGKDADGNYTACTVAFYLNGNKVSSEKNDGETVSFTKNDGETETLKCFTYKVNSFVGSINLTFSRDTSTNKIKENIRGIVITGKIQYMRRVVKYSVSGSFADSGYKDMSLTDTDGNDLLMYYENDLGMFIEKTPTVMVNAENSRISFNVPTVPALEGDSNITVSYCAVAEGASEEYENIINGCTFGEIISDGASSDILVISGYDKRRNVCFFSEATEGGGFDYFPDLNYASFGDEREGITALLRLSDSSLGVFKDRDFYRASVNFTSDSENLTFQTALRKYDTADTYGCFNPYVAANVNSDSMVLSYVGVLGVTSQADSYERSLSSRSSKINKELCRDIEILKNAVACEYDGRYYLFLNDDEGTVYVADSRYKYYESDRIDTSYEYEWWIFKGLPARYVAVVGNEMLMGTDDGTVYKFGSGYEDGYFINLNSDKNDFYVNYVNNNITVNASSGMKGGDRVTLSEHTEVISNSATVSGGKIILSKSDFYGDDKDNKVIRIFEGAKYIVSKGDEEYEGTVADIDYDYFTVTLDKDIGDEDSGGWSVSEVIAADSRIYDVYKNGENFKLMFDGKYVALSSDRPITYIHIDRREPVKCVYISPTFDLGSYIQPKDLFNISVIGGMESGNFIFGYETIRNIREKSILRRTENDFYDVDFKEYTFNGTFTQSCTMRAHERNFNFIRFIVRSDNNADCSFESLSAIYTVKNNILKGVK